MVSMENKTDTLKSSSSNWIRAQRGGERDKIMTDKTVDEMLDKSSDSRIICEPDTETEYLDLKQ